MCLDAAAVVNTLKTMLVNMRYIATPQFGVFPGAQTHTHAWSHAPCHCRVSALSRLTVSRFGRPVPCGGEVGTAVCRGHGHREAGPRGPLDLAAPSITRPLRAIPEGRGAEDTRVPSA